MDCMIAQACTAGASLLCLHVGFLMYLQNRRHHTKLLKQMVMFTALQRDLPWPPCLLAPYDDDYSSYLPHA